MKKLLILTLLIFLTGCTNAKIISNSNNSIKSQDNIEINFEDPIDINWTGKVLTYMESYNAYAIEMISGDAQYERFYAQPFKVLTDSDNNLIPQYKMGDYLNIQGEFTGITCAYKNSIFDEKCVPDINVKSVTNINKNITISTHKEHIDISYPEFTNNNHLNKEIKTIIDNHIEKSRKNQKEIISEQEECLDLINTEYSFCSVTLSSVYEISEYKNIISIKFIFTDFTGGGLGCHDQAYILNYDKENNKVLANTDIFCDGDYITKIKPLTLNYLVELQDKNEFSPFHTNEEFLNLDNETFENITLHPKGINVSFQPYSFTSGASGIVDVSIPYSEIGNILCDLNININI